MNYRALYYLAAKSLSIDTAGEVHLDAIEKLFRNDKIPFDALVKCCDKNYALPSVYSKLLKNGFDLFLPEELRDYLGEILSLNRERNRAILLQIGDLCKLLDKSGIVPVFLEGTAHLLDDLYSDQGERLIGDISFLVEQENFMPTAKLLLKSGYDIIMPHSFDYAQRMKHFPILGHLNYPANLKIHQRLEMPPLDKGLHPENIYRDKQSISGLSNCFVPSFEHQFLHSLIDDQQHRHRFKETALCSIYDWYLLAQRTDPKKVIEKMAFPEKAEGDLLFAGYAMGLFEKFFSTDRREAKIHFLLSDLALKKPALTRIYISSSNILDEYFSRYLRTIIREVVNLPDIKNIQRRLDIPYFLKNCSGINRNLFQVPGSRQ